MALNYGSVATTGGVTVTAASLAPFYDWAFAGFPADDVPKGLSLLVAAITITAAHMLVVGIQRRFFPDPQPVVVTTSPAADTPTPGTTETAHA